MNSGSKEKVVVQMFRIHVAALPFTFADCYVKRFFFNLQRMFGCFFVAAQIKTAPVGLWREMNGCLTNTIALHNQLNPSGKHTLTLGDLYSRGGGEGGRTPFENRLELL